MDVVFLDIDGVLIPSSVFMLEGADSSIHLKFSDTCVACLKHLCKETGAVIVTNTTHNGRFKERLLPALEKVGLSEFVIGHTDYPHCSYSRKDDSESPRDIAVKKWLSEHPEVRKWVAFDDDWFTEDERLIRCDSNCGIGVREMNAALTAFEAKTVLIFM